MKIRPAVLSACALVLFIPGMERLAALPVAQEPAAATAPESEQSSAWRQDLAAWRAQREREISTPDGWLTLVGLEWLQTGVTTFGAAQDNRIQIHTQAPDHIGLFTVSGKPGEETVQLLAPRTGFPPELTLDGAPAREGAITVNDIKPSVIAWHGITLVVLRRGDRFALRVKDAGSATRTGFHGLNWYPPDPTLRVAARWTPYVPPHIEKIPTVIGTTLDLPAPGVAEFSLDGKTFRLEPVIEDPGDQVLFFILRDTTSRATTYQAARFLHTGLPDHGLDQPGTLILDFNRLENPPCAYTPYATCPLPPEQNRLPVALEAGELRYKP